MQIKDYLPFLHWWPEVTRRTLRADLMAGITGAVIVLPQGVAFAIIAGLPPEYGLYSAIVPAIIAAMLGSSLSSHLRSDDGHLDRHIHHRQPADRTGRARTISRWC